MMCPVCKWCESEPKLTENDRCELCDLKHLYHVFGGMMEPCFELNGLGYTADGIVDEDGDYHPEGTP